jgi:hypothetical protein
MNEYLIAVKVGDSNRENCVLGNVIGILGNIKEGSIKIDSNKLGYWVSLRSLGSGEVEGEHGVKNVSHEVASTFLKLLIQVINNLLNGRVYLR